MNPAGARFVLGDVDHAPDDLYDQVPCEGVLVRRLPGPDRPDYWLARLAAPLRWSDAGTPRSIEHLVLVSRFIGQSIDEPFTSLTVGVAYVVDETLLADAALAFDKARYVAVGTIRRVPPIARGRDMKSRQRFLLRLGLVVASTAALALAWGYWHAMTHVALNIHVEDHGPASSKQIYGTPHDVTVTFRDRAGRALATARSIEPAGYVLAVHPSPDIGTCEHRVAPGDYASCYARYSAWASGWAPDAHRADIRIGACQLRGVPVASSVSNGEWLLWWVPLPHVGGRPRRYFDLAIAVDSRACVAVDRR